MSGQSSDSESAPRDGRGSATLLAALVSELGRHGVCDVVASPGSRNTPLLSRLAEQSEIKVHSVIDERTAGFFALGLAKASGSPVALSCTSGSAVANYLPAVVEADHAGVPLLLLTADRPAELQAVGAGQTISQNGIFGSSLRLGLELSLDHANQQSLRFVRSLAARMVYAATGSTPGPVQLNLPLREPLIAEPDRALLDAEQRSDAQPWVGLRGGLSRPDEDAISAVGELLIGNSNVVVVAGRHEAEPAFGAALSALCELLMIPLLADPLSGARRGGAAIASYDAILRRPAESLPTPTAILRFGDLPTSKPLRQWLAGMGSSVAQVHVSAQDSWQDPDGVLSQRVLAAPLALLEELSPRLAIASPDPDWLARWKSLDGQVCAAQGSVLEADEQISEPWLAKELCAVLPNDATLLVAASMPIRDVEAMQAPRTGLRVLANRGANGIDGTIATAWGLSVDVAAKGPVALLIGDVATLHDIGSLIAASQAKAKFIVVLVDNGGGGIFSFLPVAKTGRPELLELIQTPTQLKIDEIAALTGAKLLKLGAKDELVPAVRAAVAHEGISIIYVKTDRAENLALHQRLAEASRSS